MFDILDERLANEIAKEKTEKRSNNQNGSNGAGSGSNEGVYSFLAQCACFVWMVCLLSVNVLVRMFVEVCIYMI